MLFESVKVSQKHRLAITDFTNERTWIELNLRVNAIATFLVKECGLRPDDHVALHIGNSVEFIEAMLAGILTGVWITPINTHLTTEEASYILENCDAKLLLHDKDHLDLVDQCDGVQYIEIGSLESIVGIPSDESIFAAGSSAGGTMLYTSGTTGRPKGVKRNKPDTLGEALSRMRSGGKLFGLEGAGPHLVTGPLYHAAPMLFALYDLLNGATMVIMPRWSTNQFLEAVDKYSVVSTHLVPTMFVRLLNEREAIKRSYNLSSLKLVLHGAAPIAKATKERMLDWWGDILVEYWGGSEAGVTTLVNSQDWKNHPGTVGRPLSHFKVYVGDKHGLPINEQKGLLFCKHEQLDQVFEYYKDPDKTQKAHPQSGVFCIGDIGYVDEAGFVYLSDRESNMIISGGVNIYPAEIEQALMENKNIADCIVFGIPNDEWGEEVRAVIQLTEDDLPMSHQDVLDFLHDKIAKYKLPRSIIFVDAIPRTPTGKVKAVDIKRLYT